MLTRECRPVSFSWESSTAYCGKESKTSPADFVIIRVSVMFAPLQVLKLYEATYTPYFQNKNNN